jgi:vacuolar-type H+-ATPase subunit I/STV1
MDPNDTPMDDTATTTDHTDEEPDLEKFSPEESVDSLTEQYFQAREDLKVLNAELRESKDVHPEQEELKKISKQASEIRKRMKMDEQIGMLDEKAKTLREKQRLLKEMIKIKLEEEEKEEIAWGDNSGEGDCDI